jgi:drug/metabolite transporter (DMT)-like permease
LAAAAVVLGYFLGGAELGLRTILGTMCVLISVVVITTTKARKDPAVTLAEETG